MCTGVEIALMATSVAMTAGSMVANKMAQDEQADAIKEAQNRYNEREAELQRQSNELFAATTPSFTREGSDATLAEQKAGLTSDYTSAIPAAQAQDTLATGSGSSQGGNKIVAAEYDKQLNNAYATGIQHAQQKAAVDAWGKNQFLKDIFLNKQKAQQGIIGNFAQGWGPVLQSELADAQSAGQGMRDLATGLKFGSMAASAGAGIAGGLSAASAAKEAAAAAHANATAAAWQPSMDSFIGSAPGVAPI